LCVLISSSHHKNLWGQSEHRNYRLKARAKNGAVLLFLLAATFCGVPATTILPP
jgi:hypothetical protein